MSTSKTAARPAGRRPSPSTKATATAGDRTWEQRLADLVAANGQLAPLLGDTEPAIVDGRRRLYPWWLRRDVSALLLWSEELQDHPAAAHITPHTDGGATITVIGMLLGEPVELIAVTHRRVPRITDGLVAWDVMFELAAEEAAALAAELPDVPLPEWTLADPIAVEVTS